MTLSEQLRQYNRWRRGEDIPPPGPRMLGLLIEAAADRLEVLERERSNHAALTEQKKTRKK